MEAIWTQRLLPLATWIEIGMEIDKPKSENNEVMKLIALDQQDRARLPLRHELRTSYDVMYSLHNIKNI